MNTFELERLLRQGLKGLHNVSSAVAISEEDIDKIHRATELIYDVLNAIDEKKEKMGDK